MDSVSQKRYCVFSNAQTEICTLVQTVELLNSKLMYKNPIGEYSIKEVHQFELQIQYNVRKVLANA